RRALVSYALYVRNRMGDKDTAKARRLIAEAGLDKLSLESVGWLLSVLSGDPASQTQVTAIRRLLDNRATETAATAHFARSSTDRQQVNVPMSYLAQKDGAQNLILSKEGAGRLYYRIGLNYAPTNLNLKAADYGFTVQRVYEAIDNPADVRRDADGTWHIKAG